MTKLNYENSEYKRDGMATIVSDKIEYKIKLTASE
jgi:hypothetical protein